MSVTIHCLGSGEDARFRLWTTNEDRYLTDPLTKAEMFEAAIMYDAWRAADRLIWTAAHDAHDALLRAEKNGSSERDGRRRRTSWETEINTGPKHLLHQPVPGMCIVDGKITVSGLQPLTPDEAMFVAARLLQQAALLAAAFAEPANPTTPNGAQEPQKGA